MHPTKLISLSEGPHQIVEVHTNRTVQTQSGGCQEDISIPMIAPFFGQEQQEQL